jgi:ribosomal-protein-alanine N-acetyltransferase
LHRPEDEGGITVLKPLAVRQAWQEVPRRYRGYVVEPLRFKDISQVARIEATVFPEPLSLREVFGKYRKPEVCYLAVRDGAHLAAYFGFEVFHTIAHVIANATAPAYRRQGLARFVLTAAEPLALAYGARCFLGEVRRSNQAQQRVLEDIGWAVVAEIPRYFGNGEDAYIVWKTLTPDA